MIVFIVGVSLIEYYRSQKFGPDMPMVAEQGAYGGPFMCGIPLLDWLEGFFSFALIKSLF